MKRFIKVTILLVLLMLMLVSSCLVGFAEEKVITFARPEDIVVLDPYNQTSVVNWNLNTLIYDRLVEYNETATGFVPSLATEWIISPDGKEYTFKLRQGVKFHNGESFNAECVKVSLERFLNEQLAGGADWKTLKEVEIVDDYTVIIKFKQPNALCLNSLAMLAMLPAKAFKEKGLKLFDESIGTGAFIFKEWKHGEHIIVDKNPDYWGKKAYVDRIVYVQIMEINTRLAAVSTGQIDIADSMPAEQIPMAEANPNLEVVGIHTWDQFYLSQSMLDPPFTDKKFREAISLAIDRESIAKYVEKAGRPSTGLIPERLLGFDDSLPPLKYDIEKAKQLVKESIYDGRELLLMAPTGWYTKIKEISEAVQSGLMEAGINVRLEMFEGATFIDRRKAGDYDLYCAGYANPGDVDTLLLQRVHDDTTGSGYKNEYLNKLIEDQRQEVNPEKRIKILREIENFINTELAPFIFIFQQDEIYFVRKGLTGVTWYSNRAPDLRWAHYEE